MPLAQCKLALPNARKRRHELPQAEPAMVLPLLARGPSVSLTRQVPVMSLPLFCLAQSNKTKFFVPFLLDIFPLIIYITFDYIN